MKYIDLTFPTSEENLACDEALLEYCEGGFEHQLLRFWEPIDYFIVLGYSGKISQETNLTICEKEKIKILRRPSGGGTVLQGPGCLNFALVLKIENSKYLENISKTNQYVLGRHKQALSPLVNSPIEIQGISDLACGTFKFSGNAQRRKRNYVLFHGTFLTQFNIPLIETFLPNPAKQPAYRKKRSHIDFLKNISLSADSIKEALRNIWQAKEILKTVPSQKIKDLVRERYSNKSWNFKF